MIPIRSPKALGAVLRETRTALRIPAEDLAEMVRTSHVSLGRLEQGKATKALQTLFTLLDELGIELHAALPPEVGPIEVPSEDAKPSRKRART